MKKLLLLLAFTLTAHAQSYPVKPVRVIIPFPPGDAADIMARLVAPKVSERLGQPMVIENRPGASGQIGMALLKDAPADGYTIGVGQGGNLVVAPHTYKKIPYDPLKDFAPVALLATNYLAVIANPNVPFHGAAEMVVWAKANPGKLTLATNGEGGFPHLAFENLAAMGGFSFQHIPYKGASQIVTDVIGGQVQLMFGNLVAVLPQVKTARLRALAVTGEKRTAAAPELPTVIEAGVPGYVVISWFGVLVPAATPRELITRLNADLARTMGAPDVRERLAADGAEPTVGTPEQFGAFIKAEIAQWTKVIKNAGIVAE